MYRCINVPFDFQGKEYYAIIRQQIINNKKNYKIRIMNHRLDALLHKSNLNVFEEEDVHISLIEASKLTEEAELRQVIITSLTNQLPGGHRANFDFISDFKLLTPF